MAISCPWYLQRPLIFLWAGLIGLVARTPRDHLAHNLKALGVPHPRFRAWLSFQRMGQVMVDTMVTEGRPQDVQWEVHDRDCMVAARETGKPVVLWTAHMGNYDAAAAFFAHRIGAKLYVVRKPELNARLHALRGDALREKADDHFAAVYSAEETLGIELLRELRNGQWVALQADRALPGLSNFDLVDGEETWQLPRGPFFLPLAAGAVCLPVFVTRLGPRRYRVQFHPHITPPATRERQAAVRALAVEWLRLLRKTVRRHPDQWFVFETLIQSPLARTRDVLPN